MSAFLAALAAFILLHVGVSATGLRGALVRALGEWPYRGLFSVASAVLLGALIWTFAQARGAAENIQLYDPPAWGRHVTATLLFLGLVLGFTGLFTPGPTTVGLEQGMGKPDAAKGVLRITRHPFLWGVALWGIGHLFANGERASVALFGGLAVMALLGARSIDRKAAARDPEAFARFASMTSNVPFLAVMAGRNRIDVGEMWWRTAAAIVLVLAIAYFHGTIIGVPAFGPAG